ncbi:DUF4440 domain-containing protein [Nonomuraea jabiensis]|uniref:DUF4440 domain-containing protein n=1 Tax=Nonomuraea jabiensis TaxID=882448 RepID=UPI003D724484
MVNDADEAACQAEVVRLHEFLQRWLSGDVPRTREEFSAFADSMEPGFSYCDPAASMLAGKQALTAVEAAFGIAPGIEIQIRNLELVAATDSLLVATYQEWQYGIGASGPRRSTVVFSRDPAAPQRLRWRHLQETWIPKPSQEP